MTKYISILKGSFHVKSPKKNLTHISKLADFWYKCSITCVYEACQAI